MVKTLKVLLISGASVVALAATIAIATYALFSDMVTFDNHLQAGTLKINLERTHLEWIKLDNETGYLVEGSSDEVIDFTNTSRENIFGIENDTYLVPGSMFEATMNLKNSGNIAFDYWIEIKTNNSDAELLDQIKVTIILNEDNQITNYLSSGLQMGSETLPVGSIAKDSAGQTFKVIIEFEVSEANNNAMNQNVYFDLVVYASQSTTRN